MQPAQTRLLPAVSVVVPCFNERDNVTPMIERLTKVFDGIEWEVTFVDDDSPDGTSEVVRNHAQENPRVHLIHRVGRRGLAGACIEGILSSRADLAAVIDGDLQHDEAKLRDMFACFSANPDLDLVIGSRNTEGGSAGDGLSKIRKWGSDQATGLARKALKISATDPMSGFFMVKRQSFNAVATQLQNQGFKILADMLSVSRGTWTIQEVPYTFRERFAGESKMDAAVTLEFLGLILSRLLGGVLPIRFILFAGVGLSGVFVQLFAVWIFLGIGLEFIWAQTFGVIVAMTSNFFLNNVLTYRDRALKGFGILYGLLSFYAVCSIGAMANVAVAEASHRILGVWVLASLLGAVFAAIWNYLVSALATWRVR